MRKESPGDRSVSLLVVGMSHRSAPVAVLERLSMDTATRDRALQQLITAPSLSEAMVISTCNRVEVYVVATAFHAGVDDVVRVLAEVSGVDAQTLRPGLYVRYAEAAARHLLSVASGLDSMVVGEQQIIGQVRGAYQAAATAATAGPVLHSLAQAALHTGKRVHTETGIDGAGASMVSLAFTHALQLLKAQAPTASARTMDPGAPLAGRTALVMGAGVMASLAATQLGRLGISHLVIANRTRERAEVLAQHAQEAGVPATAVDFGDRARIARTVDVVVSATGADVHTVEAADLQQRDGGSGTPRPLLLIDLSMPRDIAQDTADLPGVQLLNIERLHELTAGKPSVEHTRAQQIVAEELEAFIAQQRVRQVAPAVAALRHKTANLVAAELDRLAQRTPQMSQEDRQEVEHAVRRVVDKLLHEPTVRIKKLAADGTEIGANSALQELFGLEEPGS